MRKAEIIPADHPGNDNVATGVISRRALLRAAAWSLPAVAVAVGTPALAASGPGGDDFPVRDDLGWYWSQSQVASSSPRVMEAKTKVNLERLMGQPQPVTAFMTVQFEAFADEDRTELLVTETKNFSYPFPGSNGDSTPDGLIEFVQEIRSDQLPQHGGQVYVKFTMFSVIGKDPEGRQFTLPLSDNPSYSNPLLGAGHVKNG